jgi:hypothetical protein
MKCIADTRNSQIITGIILSSSRGGNEALRSAKLRAAGALITTEQIRREQLMLTVWNQGGKAGLIKSGRFFITKRYTLGYN